LRLPAEAMRIREAIDWIDAQCAAHRLSADMAMWLAIVLEEAVVNVMRHGGSPTPSLELRFSCEMHAVELVIDDDGVPFDPTAVELEELSDDIDERRVGGLGIRMIRGMMDEVVYSRAEGRNRLVLRKHR
jgi:serine/threonine-protein kinase RsbW